MVNVDFRYALVACLSHVHPPHSLRGSRYTCKNLPQYSRRLFARIKRSGVNSIWDWYAAILSWGLCQHCTLSATATSTLAGFCMYIGCPSETADDLPELALKHRK